MNTPGVAVSNAKPVLCLADVIDAVSVGDTPHIACIGRDREALGSRERLCGAADALGCRAYVGVAQSLPPPRQGLREPQPQYPGVPPTRINPPNAAKAQPGSNPYSVVRLKIDYSAVAI
jgi:hypothetical protein